MSYIVAIDGPDKSGKDTLIERVSNKLRGIGIKSGMLRSPGGSPLGDILRDILLNRKEELKIHNNTELLTHILSMVALTEKHGYDTLFSLAKGIDRKPDVWIMNRSIISTFVYQAMMGQRKEQWKLIHDLASLLNILIPKTVYILCSRTETLLERIKCNREEVNEYEKSLLEKRYDFGITTLGVAPKSNLERLNDAYHEIADMSPELAKRTLFGMRIVKVNTEKSIQECVDFISHDILTQQKKQSI